MKIQRKSEVTPQHSELLQMLKQKKDKAIQKWKTKKQHREELREIQHRAHQEAHRAAIMEALREMHQKQQ